MFNYFITVLILITSSSAWTDNSRYFMETYDQSDRAFVEQFANLKKINPKATIHQFRYSDGTIRSFFFPAKQKQENLLIMISGTHGIEGLAGSAVQRWFLDQNINTDKTAILMIHGFNIYGFKTYRRVNENNIDLNRNFILARDVFKTNDLEYTKLNSFLNPETSPSVNIFSHLGFIFRAAYNVATQSMESLRTSILKGQYSHAKGIFYGGDSNAIQSALILDLVASYMKPYKKIFLIDLHTGYGKKSKLHLFAGRSNDANAAVLNQIFDKNEIDYSDKKNFYQTEGDVITYFIDKIRLNVDAEISGIVFEYGTLDSQTTLGSIESLRRVILENQNFHYPTDTESSKKIAHLYLEMFYPSDPTWRSSILEQTNARMQQVFKYLNQ